MNKLKKILERFYNVFNLFFKNKNNTYVWCVCGNEMVHDVENEENLSFIRDVYIENRNIVHYKCSKCKVDSFFDFDHPVPIKLPFSDNDNIIEQYCEKFEEITYGKNLL